jgi:hypothetical protein
MGKTPMPDMRLGWSCASKVIGTCDYRSGRCASTLGCAAHSSQASRFTSPWEEGGDAPPMDAHNCASLLESWVVLFIVVGESSIFALAGSLALAVPPADTSFLSPRAPGTPGHAVPGEVALGPTQA